MLTVYAAHCWILRLPCKTESNFEVKLEGHILKNCVLEESSVTSVEQCFEKCENHAKCKSVNHKQAGENNCQLNSKLKEVSPAIDFAASSSWTYYATNHSRTNVCDLVFHEYSSRLIRTHCPGMTHFFLTQFFFMSPVVLFVGSCAFCVTSPVL